MKGEWKYRRIGILGKEYRYGDLCAAALFLLPAMVAALFFSIIPILRMAFLSFSDYRMDRGSGRFNGFDNFIFLLSDEKFLKSLLNTFAFAISKLLLETAIALVIAFMLDGRIPGRKFLRSSYFAPVVVPVVASALVWLWFFDPSAGPLNSILESLGLPRSEWIYSEKSALFSVVVFSIWKGVGYEIALFSAALTEIPPEVVEAARTDGASDFSIALSIKLPLMAPVFSFVTMMGIINAFKVFAETNVLTPKGGPLYSTALIVNYIYDTAFVYGKMGRAAAASLMLFLLILILTAFSERAKRKWKE